MTNRPNVGGLARQDGEAEWPPRDSHALVEAVRYMQDWTAMLHRRYVKAGSRLGLAVTFAMCGLVTLQAAGYLLVARYLASTWDLPSRIILDWLYPWVLLAMVATASSATLLHKGYHRVALAVAACAMAGPIGVIIRCWVAVAMADPFAG